MRRDLRPLYLVVALGLALVSLTARLYLQGAPAAADANSCKSVSMYPSYARIRSFNESHTHLAFKYSLYLYREQGKDKVPAEVGQGFDALDGIPVLFVPGNAGSYRQVRSIAAECANLWAGSHAGLGGAAQNLDFFAADFNEDFTAFHGRTLLDQAEYLNDAVRFVLSLYARQATPPAAVLVVAHSMGGIVARAMPTVANWAPGAVNTIVTLSSPHAAAPLTFDGDILRVYSAADRFWHDAFHTPSAPHYGVLDDVALVSITGGVPDAVLPADYTALGYLVPPTNGFAVYTSGVPAVWSPMDHLAIVWCRQLRRAVATALLRITDRTTPQKTVPLRERMAVFRRLLLTGFESYAQQDSALGSAQNPPFGVIFDSRDLHVHSSGSEIWKSAGGAARHLITLLPLSENSTVSVLEDSYLPTRPHTDIIDFALYLCKREGSASSVLDFARPDTQEYMEMFCVNTTADFRPVPRSAADVDTLADSALDGGHTPFRALQYKSDQIREFEFLMIVDGEPQSSTGFAIVQTAEARDAEQTLSLDMGSLILRGLEVSLLPNRPLAVNINIPGAWSSLLALKVHMKEESGDLFEPFVRQWVDDPYETKWHIKLRGESEFVASIHSVAPYVPFLEKKVKSGMNLQIWSDPQGGWSKENVAAIELTVSVDWLQSLRLLVLRYRLAVVSQCLAVTIAVTLIQFAKFANTGKFPDYTSGISQLTEPKLFFPIFFALCLLTPLLKLSSVQGVLNLIDPVVIRDPLEINLSLDKSFILNSFYLGLEENWLAFMGGLFFVMAIALNFVVYHVLSSIALLLVYLGRLVFRGKTEVPPKRQILTGKLIGSFLLLLAIPFYLPYQFAFMICYAVQVITCIRGLWSNWTKSSWNYNLSFLMIMTWVLPINVPVLIVFVHNFNVNWATPFSSHHNILAVAPILALVEIHSYYGNMLPVREERTEGKTWLQKATMKLLQYTAAYSIIYGVRHTYWLHHSFNFWCCGMALVFVEHLMVSAEKQQ